ncbi:MAG: DegV family protein [Anaerolineae bacterium]
MIQIFTDSTADLGPELALRYGIRTVPLTVQLAGTSYTDGVDLDAHRLFGLVEQTGTLPTTAAPSVAQFCQAFQGSDEVLYVGISAQLSSSVQNAQLAALECPHARVHVVDSRNLSAGIGLLALYAATLRDCGLSFDAIEAAVRAAVPQVRTAFVIDTLEYLHMGGRCTALQSFVGSLLKLRPIIGVSPEGTLGVQDKVRGSRRQALDRLLVPFRRDLPQLDRQRVFITHTACPEDAEALAAEVAQLAAPAEVLITEAGCVIASHCGPNTIGILYRVTDPV